MNTNFSRRQYSRVWKGIGGVEDVVMVEKRIERTDIQTEICNSYKETNESSLKISLRYFVLNLKVKLTGESCTVKVILVNFPVQQIVFVIWFLMHENPINMMSKFHD
jgi:hypothetical protein